LRRSLLGGRERDLLGRWSLMATVEQPRTHVRAEARYVRTAPRKAQLVVDQIRGRSVPEARTILAFMTRDAAKDVELVLRSAVANAEANHGLVGDDLYVATAFVGAGPTLRRWRARARGRVARIRKRTCHITIALALPEGGVIPEPIVQPLPAPVVMEPEPEPEAAPEETPKPKRTRAAKPKTEEKPKAEKKPRATKPKAEKTTEEKPKRATTRKKKEDS
jgi:large subunit ribosomal protein L22